MDITEVIKKLNEINERDDIMENQEVLIYDSCEDDTYEIKDVLFEDGQVFVDIDTSESVNE